MLSYYEPFDLELARDVVDGPLDPLVQHYFRPLLIGAERLSSHGPLILAPNHSGNAFPYDGMLLDALLWKRDGMRAEAKFRALFERQLALTWWMRPYGLDNFWRRCGGVDLTFDNFGRVLERGERVMYFPEGVPGIGKGFNRRYQLQPFHKSFILHAARHNAAVHPVHIINAEWVVPFGFTLPAVDRIVQKRFGVPFLPLPVALIAITFPFAWWLSLPARMVFVIEESIDIPALLKEEGVTDLDDPDPVRLGRVAERIREQMQGELDRHVARYGRRPYEARSLWKELWRALRRGRLARTLPTGWVPSFIRFDRDRQRPPARGRLHGLLRDWDLLAFYVPFGWPLIALLRKLRRPPCGYRGLSEAERAERQGRFVWHLESRPLPTRD